MKDYKKLQNGSDIRGIAVEGVSEEKVNLTPKEAFHIAAGFAKWLREDKGIDDSCGNSSSGKELTVAVGRDPRISGPDLLSGLMKGFAAKGIKVYECGLASTPAMFMSTVFKEFECDGAVMITASHLPFNRNGFKFFTGKGGLNKNDIGLILEYANSCEKNNDKLREEIDSKERKISLEKACKADLMTVYCAHLRKIIKDGADMGDKPLEGMKIVVDAGNGGGGFFAERVLAPLGADVSASQFLKPDGMFPNHAPNPENKEAMKAISEQVTASGADFGIIFDTDVDRSAAVDEMGNEIARNGIVAMAASLVAETGAGSTVVTDSITSTQLTEFIENELGLVHLRFKRGYKNVINKAQELNEQGTDCRLAIETSGHAALKENYFLDDGAYLATKIVVKAARLKREGKALSKVLEKLKEPADELEVRIPITCDDFSSYADRVLEELEAYAAEEEELSLAVPNYEGVRINFPDGWCLLRKSLHDPIMPMNMASDSVNGCMAIKEKMRLFLEKYSELDIEGRL